MNTAVLALDAVVELLADAGIAATRDPGAFYPQPLGVAVGLPTLDGATLSGRTYTVPVYVVSGEPLSTPDRIDALYTLADAVADAIGAAQYEPHDYRGTANADALPAVRLDAIATVQTPTLQPTEA